MYVTLHHYSAQRLPSERSDRGLWGAIATKRMSMEPIPCFDVAWRRTYFFPIYASPTAEQLWLVNGLNNNVCLAPALVANASLLLDPERLFQFVSKNRHGTIKTKCLKSPCAVSALHIRVHLIFSHVFDISRLANHTGMPSARRRSIRMLAVTKFSSNHFAFM
jgi:hypothetical protein